jgi:hypothetical protein
MTIEDRLALSAALTELASAMTDLNNLLDEMSQASQPEREEATELKPHQRWTDFLHELDFIEVIEMRKAA